MPKVRETSKPRFRAVGCHIFAGGFTVGVQAAGFDVLCHLEGKPAYGAEVVRLNFPSLPIHEGFDAWPVDELVDGPEIDLVYGNPPCAAWSGNNPNSYVVDAWKTDPRVNCTREHFSLLKRLRPKVWMWESVTQAPIKGRELVDELTAEALALGYSVTEVLHDAKDLGTPQTRRRWFMIAHRVELDFPESALLPEISAVDALAEVEPRGVIARDSGKNIDFDEHIPSIRPGQRLRDYQDRHLTPDDGWEVKANGQMKGRVGFGHVRLKVDGPSTATVGYSMIHPVEHRFLTVNEVQRLAGFPDDYEFMGGENGAKQLDYIARGVCPPVGEWFAKRIAEGLARNVEVTEPIVKKVDLISPRAKTRSKVKLVKPIIKTNTNAILPSSRETRVSVKSTGASRNSLRGKVGVPGSKPQDFERRYDTTQLRENGHGRRVHRDYAAHYFRWGWASRFVEAGKTRVLDVGCGQDLPMVKILTASLSTVPAKYVGVDLNRVKTSGISWVAKIYDEFDFPGGGWETVLAEQGEFNLISCFEVIEHMHREDGLRLLSGMRECLDADGKILLSTPVYNGRKMAANHLKEYTVDELQELIEETGLIVVERFGTFASWNDVRRVCTAQERALIDEVGRFYGGDVLACFLAPKYPDASRNNAWVLSKS